MRYKKTLTITLLIISISALLSSSGKAFDFDDIQFWVGTGNSRAGLVIDWNDGKEPVSLAWGFRWNGSATGRTMLDAVVTADPRLFECLTSYGPLVVYGLGYDLNGNGFSYVPGPNDSGHAADPEDHYREGWMTAGYWSYWLKANSSSNWEFSSVGISGHILTDGCWDGWSFAAAPSWNGGAPDAPLPAPVPEPSPFFALVSSLVGMGGLAVHRRIKEFHKPHESAFSAKNGSPYPTYQYTS